jgi:hypothetical protein
MSDAIVLDVDESPTIALDAGTADPVARDQIAELQAEVAALTSRIATIEDTMPDAVTYTVDEGGNLTLGLTRTEESNG